MSHLEIRDLDGIDECRAAVTFQESVWGRGFSERVPASLMKVTQRIGGVAAGAFDADGGMVGFVYGMTGVDRAGALVHWSDILAVRPGLRDHGLGRRLKAYQREKVLRVGARRMYWTFDPLESRNAYLNLGRLGAVVREYVVDMYGTSDSPLHRGLGTDRFVVTWEMDSSRVVGRLLRGEPAPTLDDVRSMPVAFGVEGLPAPDGAGDESPAPKPSAGAPGGEPGPLRSAGSASDGSAPHAPGEVPVADVAAGAARAGGLRVPIPADIQGLRDRDPALAARWRAATRRVLAPLLSDGWVVEELVRDTEPPGAVSYYVLGPPTDRSPEPGTP